MTTEAPHSAPRAPRPGQCVCDPATGRVGVLQAVHNARELLFSPKTAAKGIAFLRPAGGGVEWTADAEALRFPEEAGNPEAGTAAGLRPRRP